MCGCFKRSLNKDLLYLITKLKNKKALGFSEPRAFFVDCTYIQYSTLSRDNTSCFDNSLKLFLKISSSLPQRGLDPPTELVDDSNS